MQENNDNTGNNNRVEARKEKLAQLPAAEFMADSLDYFGGAADNEGYDTRLNKARVKLTELEKDKDSPQYKEMLNKMRAWVALEEENTIQFMLTTRQMEYREYSYEDAKHTLAGYHETDLGKYQEILNRGRSARYTTYNVEAERATPFKPFTSGADIPEETYITLDIEWCDGPLKNVMQIAFDDAGRTVIGNFIAAEEKIEWSYAVKCITHNPGAIDIKTFLDKVRDNFSPKLKTNDDKTKISFQVKGSGMYTTKVRRIRDRKEGTCEITATFLREKPDVKPKDSPQYSAGKEMVPVH